MVLGLMSFSCFTISRVVNCLSKWGTRVARLGSGYVSTQRDGGGKGDKIVYFNNGIQYWRSSVRIGHQMKSRGSKSKSQMVLSTWIRT